MQKKELDNDLEAIATLFLTLINKKLEKLSA
jgi:hypothetical protein